MPILIVLKKFWLWKQINVSKKCCEEKHFNLSLTREESKIYYVPIKDFNTFKKLLVMKANKCIKKHVAKKNMLIYYWLEKKGKDTMFLSEVLINLCVILFSNF